MGDLLFLAHRVPYPPDRGDKIRSYNILKHLAERHRVHLAAFADDEADEAAADGLKPLVAKMHIERRTRSRGTAAALALALGKSVSVTAFAHKGMAAFVDRLLADEPIEHLYVFSSQMAQYAPDDRPFVMDFVDMDSEKFAAYGRAARPPMRWMWEREARRLFRFERETARRAVVSLFVSEAEAALFRDRARMSDEQVQALENGIDLENYRPEPHPQGQAPLIVFTGQMDYPPNIEAASSFAREAMPMIRARFPDARFAIVGRKPDASLIALAGRHGVEVTGEVADVRPWLAQADVVVAPLRIARGIQNKVLEAMAMGRPVITSPQAFEGLRASPGRDLLLAEGTAETARAVHAVLAGRHPGLGAAGRRAVEAGYDWNRSLQRLDTLMGLADHAPPAARMLEVPA